MRDANGVLPHGARGGADDLCGIRRRLRAIWLGVVHFIGANTKIMLLQILQNILKIYKDGFLYNKFRRKSDCYSFLFYMPPYSDKLAIDIQSKA